MPDEEYSDPSKVLVEKFLIKWQHASFIHVSWETEKDLLDNVGTAAKGSINRFRQRWWMAEDLWDDLANGEHFLASFLEVER